LVKSKLNYRKAQIFEKFFGEFSFLLHANSHVLGIEVEKYFSEHLSTFDQFKDTNSLAMNFELNFMPLSLFILNYVFQKCRQFHI